MECGDRRAFGVAAGCFASLPGSTANGLPAKAQTEALATSVAASVAFDLKPLARLDRR
jgi:hypothetical protein